MKHMMDTFGGSTMHSQHSTQPGAEAAATDSCSAADPAAQSTQHSSEQKVDKMDFKWKKIGNIVKTVFVKSVAIGENMFSESSCGVDKMQCFSACRVGEISAGMPKGQHSPYLCSYCMCSFESFPDRIKSL